LRRGWSIPPSPCARGRTVPVGLDQDIKYERDGVRANDGTHTRTRSSSRTRTQLERGAQPQPDPECQVDDDAQRQPAYLMASYADGHADPSETVRVRRCKCARRAETDVQAKQFGDSAAEPEAPGQSNRLCGRGMMARSSSRALASKFTGATQSRTAQAIWGRAAPKVHARRAQRRAAHEIEVNTQTRRLALGLSDTHYTSSCHVSESPR